MLKLGKGEPHLYRTMGYRLKDNIHFVCTSLFREYDVGTILDHLENLLVLPASYQIANSSKELFENNVKISNHTIHIAKHNFSKLKKELDTRMETFRAIRTIYPDFAKDIKKTLPRNECNIYNIATGNYINNLNKLYDFLYDNESYSKIINCNYEDVWIKTKDIVAEMIDTPQVNKLAFMQDNYVLGEFQRIDPTQFDKHIQNNIKEIENQLHNRIAKYELYKNPKGHKPYIENSDKKTDGDER